MSTSISFRVQNYYQFFLIHQKEELSDVFFHTLTLNNSFCANASTSWLTRPLIVYFICLFSVLLQNENAIRPKGKETVTTQTDQGLKEMNKKSPTPKYYLFIKLLNSRFHQNIHSFTKSTSLYQEFRMNKGHIILIHTLFSMSFWLDWRDGVCTVLCYMTEGNKFHV